jgi:tetratricopeptide (TPR) repeat protein
VKFQLSVFVILCFVKKYLFLILIILAATGCSRVGESLNAKGAEAFGQKHLEAANRYFRWATLLDPDNAAAWNNKGYALYISKSYDQSEKAFKTALDCATDKNLIRQIKLDEAMLYCDPQAILGSPPHKDWIRKGTELFKALVTDDPDNAELHMRLGFAYFRAANPGGGFSELDKAVQLATPKQVSHYTSNPVKGSLLILQQIQRFYASIGYLKQVGKIQARIFKLEKLQTTAAGPA